nr:DNA helicase [Tanacetum cinerariifolium]
MGGRVVLRTHRVYPEYIKLLLTGRHFLQNIRAYNQMFTMTSLGAHIDDSINVGRGPYVFKISGQLYHWIGSLCPAEGEPPRFLQLCIYDTDNEVDNRLRHFGGQNSILRRDIVKGLIELLDAHNALVQLFRTAREKFVTQDVPDFKVRLYNVVGTREYELPTGDMLGAIVYEAGPEMEMDYDIVIEERSGHPQRVNKLHPSYMSLQFPLLFIYGQDGYSKDMKLAGCSKSASADERRLTMKAYYAYYLHDRVGCSNLLSRGGRLFQQYVVTAFCAIEQNGIDFVREHQNDIRNEYLSGIYDAIIRGIVTWPEISEYMEDYPGLTSADRADVVDRVFEMKIHQFINFIRDAQPFGKIIAVLYTVEFQKRGLPHCHTLIWIDESMRVQRDQDIDAYISAELPSKDVDPEGHRVVSELMMHGPCGYAYPAATCMQKSTQCGMHFPKQYCDRTYTDKEGFVHYRRRNTQVTTVKQYIELDSSYVVPYNRQLCMLFYAHINVEYCGWTMLIKYLFKYISKGTDRVVARISRPTTDATPSGSRPQVVIDKIIFLLDARRRYQNKSSIGRMSYEHPAAGDLFYQRMLLCHQTGCTSFKHIRTVNDVVFPTCRAACEAMGLLGDDREWEYSLQESAQTATPAELRTQFAHILIFCQVSDPLTLWKRTWESMSHDIPRTASVTLNIPALNIDSSRLENYVLYELERCLNQCSRSLTDFDLPPPPEDLVAELRNRILMEEKSYDRVLLAEEKERLVPQLNDRERIIYNLIINAAVDNKQELVFVYGHGERPFGGKTIMLGGDFRQTLPAKKSASKNEIISLSIAASYLWRHFKLYSLTENMRLSQGKIDETDKEKIAVFAQWLLDIGDGCTGTPDDTDPENTSWIDIPPAYCNRNNKHGVSNLISFIYAADTLQHPTAETLQQKAIVCPKNETADIINAKVPSMLPGNTRTYISYDEATPHSHDGGEVELLYPTEYLNTLSFAGLPPHRLQLKVGTPKMLMRNINIVGGLCNGTCMIVSQLLPKVIEAQIITGTRVSQKVYLPRIPLRSQKTIYL